MNEALRETALREKLVASPGEITAWVRQAVGRELTQRRLLILDSSRVSAPPPPGISDSEQPRTPISDGPTSGRGRSHREEGESRTVRLSYAPPPPRTMRRALLVAAILAAGAVVVSLAWPGALSRIFSMDTGTVTSKVPAIDIAPVPSGAPNDAPQADASPATGEVVSPTGSPVRPKGTRSVPRPF